MSPCCKICLMQWNRLHRTYKAAARFSDWCESRSIHDLKLVRPTHVAAFIEELLQGLSKPSGKRHDVPANHNLDEYLEAYLKGVDLEADPKGPLFRTAVRKSDALTRRPLSQADAYRMIRRRAKVAGIHTKIGNHTFERRELPRISGMAAVWRLPSRSRRMSRHERRAFTTGAPMT